jgi:hypothetical protein
LFAFYDIIKTWETRAGRLTLFQEGLPLHIFCPMGTKERRAMPMYVTYTDLIQIGIFIVALVGLCHQIFKDKRK